MVFVNNITKDLIENKETRQPDLALEIKTNWTRETATRKSCLSFSHFLLKNRWIFVIFDRSIDLTANTNDRCKEMICKTWIDGLLANNFFLFFCWL